jgi:hypothetical protein
LIVMVAMNAAFGVARAQGTWSTARLSVAREYLAAASVGNVALFAGGQRSYSAVVDVYNGTTGAWSTAQLSVARSGLAATSVGNVAVFAGGQASSALLCKGEGGYLLLSAC